MSIATQRERTVSGVGFLGQLARPRQLGGLVSAVSCHARCGLSLSRSLLQTKLNLVHFSRNKKYVLWNAGICPIASKVGHVTLTTPPFGVIHHPLYTTSSNGSNRENSSLKNLISEHWDPLGCRFSITVTNLAQKY